MKEPNSNTAIHMHLKECMLYFQKKVNADLHPCPPRLVDEDMCSWYHSSLPMKGYFSMG